MVPEDFKKPYLEMKKIKHRAPLTPIILNNQNNIRKDWIRKYSGRKLIDQMRAHHPCGPICSRMAKNDDFKEYSLAGSEN